MDEARDRDNCRSSRPGTTNEVCRTKYHPPCSILELQRLAKRTASTSPSLARARSRSPVTLSRGAPRAWPPFLSTGHLPEELLLGPLLNPRHLHQPRLQRPIHILRPRATSTRSLSHMCALPSTRCARRSSPASRAAHFSRSSSSWRSAGARLCSAASSPRCHRLRRTEGHYACTAHERSLYSPVFAAASPASTQLPRTLIPQVASGCSGTNIYTAEPA